MQTATVPANEAARLAVLAQLDILDTAPEPEFDGLARLAAELCQTPIALISLVDDARQWFKAKVGLTALEAPRDQAFCAHAMLHPQQLFVVPDTAADERFHDNPMVTGEPKIRFYAGMPLTTKEGVAVGMLCIIDRQPRNFPPEKAEALQLLARQVVAQLELRLSNQRLAQANRALQENMAAQQALTDEVRDLYNQAPCGYHSLDANGMVIRMNDTELKWLGYTREEVIGKRHFTDFLTPEAIHIFQDNFPRFRVQGSINDLEFDLLRRDGTTIPVLLNATAINDEDGNFVASRSICFDLTKRRWAEDALKANEAVTRSIIENLAVGLITMGEHGLIEFSNPLAEAMFGYEHWDMIGLPVPQLFALTTEAADPEEFLASLSLDTLGATSEYHGRRKDGTVFPLELSLFEFYTNDRRNLACNVKDISERRNNERLQAEYLDALEKARQELERKVQERTEALNQTVRNLQEQVRERLRAEDGLRQLSHRLVEVQEAERRHIARELHDEVGQFLTGLKLVLEMSDVLPASERPSHLQEAQGLVNELLRKVRQISLDLRPGMLDDLGLQPALLWHLNRFQTQTGITVNFVNVGLEGHRFDARLETAAYRIVQESLTNVARYAGVSEVSVRVWADAQTLNVQIEDQGCGFDPAAAIAAGVSSGLAGMRERATLLGGTLTIESEPNAGTSVLAVFPLH